MGNYAFIDSQNLHLGISKNILDQKSKKILREGWKLDYSKLRRYLKDKYHIQKAFLFLGYRAENKMLYKDLKQSGFILIFKPTIMAGHTLKGNVDAELVLHTMIEFLNYDKAIIISNDGDFYCLIEYLSKKNKLLKILTPNGNYSRLLRKFHRNIENMDNLREKLEYLKKATKINNRSKP